MDRYVDEVAEKLTKAELDDVFATIAAEEGLFDDTFTKAMFLASLSDRMRVIMPTWFEHKEALAIGVFKAPQHVLDGKLIVDTDSAWDVDEYEAVLLKNL